MVSVGCCPENRISLRLLLRPPVPVSRRRAPFELASLAELLFSQLQNILHLSFNFYAALAKCPQLLRDAVLHQPVHYRSHGDLELLLLYLPRGLCEHLLLGISKSS